MSNNNNSRSVRVTYLDRTKGKRNQKVKVDAEGNSDSTNEDDSQASATSASMKNIPSRPKTPKSTKGAATPAKSRKKVEDAKVAAASSQCQVDETDPQADHSKPTQTPGRRAPSVASRRSKRLSNVGNKPASGQQSVRGRRSEDEDEDEDEEGSAADSIAESMVLSSAKIRRDVKDRQQYFSNQSDCATFGPHRALCSRCKTFVNLSKQQTFAVAPWEKHRAKCDQELASDAQLPPNAEEGVNLPASQVFVDRAVRRSAGERRTFLEADNLAEIVEEHRVKCRNCQKWIALRKKQTYDVHNWKLHRDKCGKDFTPSEPTGVVQRRDDTVSVPQELHKEIRGADSPANGEKNSVPFPGSNPAAEPVSLPQSPASAPVPQILDGQAGGEASRAVKRPRDVEVDQNPNEPLEEERPTNRPRKESTALDWLMLPFRSFVRGFRESLTFDDSDRP
ncbi:hypothetical protein BKA70DRAFT_1418868 [Coprinopsis sp. MPI-PUGE-AT-0042]|nr:hypothetical protein BKA70DRAFT_1418868 [Coprinopsis sp. MPI-PUGE-AT-0042]